MSDFLGKEQVEARDAIILPNQRKNHEAHDEVRRLLSAQDHRGAPHNPSHGCWSPVC